MTIVETVQGGQTRQTRIQAPELFQGPAPAPVPAPEASTAHDAPSRTAAQAVTGGPAGVANAFGAMRLTDQVPAVPPTQQPQPLPSIRAGVPQGQGATPHGPPGGGQTAGGQAPLEAGAQDVGIQVTVRIHPDSHLHALRNQMQVTVVQRQGERALVRLQFPGNQVIQVQVPDEALATRRLNIDIAPQRNQPGAPAGQAAPGPPASPAGG